MIYMVIVPVGTGFTNITNCDYVNVDAHLEPLEVLETQTSHGLVALKNSFNFFSAGVSEFAHLGEEEGVLTGKFLGVKIHFELRLRTGVVAKHTLWAAGYTKLEKLFSRRRSWQLWADRDEYTKH